MLVISIPIGLIAAVGIAGWIIINLTISQRRRKRLDALRKKQGAKRMAALEKTLRPPLMQRLKSGWRKRA